VDGKSILGLLLLAAARGSELTIIAHGEDEQAALQALVDLIGRGFEDS
jgi:phosphocarrier protein